MSLPVEVSGLSKTFKKTQAVDGLSFSVEAGQVCGLLGPNGAGKTTTLRMLVGLIHPSAGAATVLGEAVAPGYPALRRVGALIDRPSFVPHLTGRKNLQIWWRAGGDRWPPPRLEQALEVAGLGSAVDRKVKTYSQGMRQRLAIAQSLMGDSELLILDEPTNGLDPGEMREMRRVLADLSSTGVTVLLSSHLLGEVEQVCSHAVVMSHGHLVATGAVDDLVGQATSVLFEVSDPARATEVLSGLNGVARVGTTRDGLVVELDGIGRAPLVDALVRAGIGVETVTPLRKLEDAFLDLVSEDEA